MDGRSTTNATESFLQRAPIYDWCPLEKTSVSRQFPDLSFIPRIGLYLQPIYLFPKKLAYILR